VLEHVQADGSVEARVGERQPAARARRRQLQLRVRAACALESSRRGVDARDGGAGSGKLRGDGAVTASDVEQSRRFASP
jgi:hypothetical protein